MQRAGGAEKRAIVILGYESTGSVFISKVISHVLGKCKKFGDWNGYGRNGKLDQNLVILHRSVPYRRPKEWFDEPDQLREALPGFKISCVICTREPSISILSRIRRFGGDVAGYQQDSARATGFFSKCLDEFPCFIWSFESMICLGEAYFKILYEWLDVETDFNPPFNDENAKYVRDRD